MFNSIFKLSLLAFLLPAINVNAVLPPSPGTYAIQNANSSLLLNLGRANSTGEIIEFPITEAIEDFQNQLWRYIPGPGNAAVLEVVSPSTFLACNPPAIGTRCTGSPLAPAPVWIVSPAGGGFLIVNNATGLALTGVDVHQPVILSEVNESALAQIWVFIDTSDLEDRSA